MRRIILIAHNVRSCHNVGSLLRTAEGLGVEKVLLTGYTPYPLLPNDSRLPHLSAKISRQIHKTALGAETSVVWQQRGSIDEVLDELTKGGWTIAAIEQSNRSVTLPDYPPPDKLALMVGREVEGIETEVLQRITTVLEIPMFGRKESFNVAQAAAMALYHCRFSNA